jgi:bacillithiol system protein YtxJ
MAWFSSNSTGLTSINWEKLDSMEFLNEILNEQSKPVLIFKHSTRCSISTMALSRFEKEWDQTTDCRIVFLDLLENRALSNAIAELTGVMHESPQVIVLVNGKQIHNASHNAISANRIHEIIANLN